MLPSASDLRFFLEVVGTLNMSRAAERLGITQPALSQSVKRLENAFDQQLLLRGKSGVKLTKPGEKLSLKARALLDDWEKLKEEAQKDGEEIRGRYTVGMHSSVALYTIQHFVPFLVQKYKNLELKLTHDLSRKITEDVISFKIDFGIVVNPVSHPDLVIRELFKDEVTFWRSKKKNAVNDPESDECVLILEPDLNQTQDLLGRLGKKRLKYKRSVTSSNLEVIKKLVMSGAGIGVVPGRVIGEEAKKMECLSEYFPKFNDRICLIYRADVQKSTASRKLIQIIKEQLSGR